MNSVKDKIYKLRKRQGLSQEELGFEIDVSRQTISKWELGTSEPDLKNLKALSKFFKVDLNYFLSEDTEIEVATTLATQNPVKEKPKAKNLLKYKVGIIVSILLIVISIFGIALRIFEQSLSFNKEPGDEIVTEGSIYDSKLLSVILLVVFISILIGALLFLIILIKKKVNKNDL